MKNNNVVFDKGYTKWDALKDLLKDPDWMFGFLLCIPCFIAWVIVACAILKYYFG